MTIYQERLQQTRKSTAPIHPSNCLPQQRTCCYYARNEWAKKETPDPSSFSHPMLFREQLGVLLHSDTTELTRNMGMGHSVCFQPRSCPHVIRNTTVQWWHFRCAWDNSLTEQTKTHSINTEVLLLKSLRSTLPLTQPNCYSGISREPQPQGL